MENKAKQAGMVFWTIWWSFLVIFLLVFIMKPVNAIETVCEECDNPLVEVKDVQFQGDLPESTDGERNKTICHGDRKPGPRF